MPTMRDGVPGSPQQDLFAGTPSALPPPVEPAKVPAELQRLAARLPRSLHLGTSSWTFPGWAGFVYDREYRESALARYGLAAYAQHPLLTGAGIDRTFYAPLAATEFAEFADQVPEHFRFLVKAYSGLTTAPDGRRGELSGRGERSGSAASVFLDPDHAMRTVVEPAVRGLRDRLGAILFQFSPLGPAFTRRPAAFAQALATFIGALPRSVPYAVELRDPELLGADYEAALRESGAVHCSNVHPRMPPVDRQVSAELPGPLVVRWMLHPAQQYEAAGERYAPFDRLVDEDPVNRSRIAARIAQALDAGREVHMIASNNAEGSAPQTLFALAAAVAEGRRVDRS